MRVCIRVRDHTGGVPSSDFKWLVAAFKSCLGSVRMAMECCCAVREVCISKRTALNRESAGPAVVAAVVDAMLAHMAYL